jgi:chemotaxis protein MotB
MTASRPVIIIKKKGGHAAHHGGAWKVAYADFVTALMSLFIVLWLMSASNAVKKAIGGYFKDPRGSAKTVGTNMVGAGQNFSLSKADLKDIKTTLQKAIQQMSDFEKLKDQIEFTITPEGLRIELLESKSGTFFDVGSAELNQSGQDLLVILAKQLGSFPNKISIEGHTDSKPYSGGGDYSNWELSADRANSARRLMQENGLRPDQVTQVRGFADQSPRVLGHPDDPSNRRVSLIVNNFVKPDGAPDTQQTSPVTGAKASGVEAGDGSLKQF